MHGAGAEPYIFRGPSMEWEQKPGDPKSRISFAEFLDQLEGWYHTKLEYFALFPSPPQMSTIDAPRLFELLRESDKIRIKEAEDDEAWRISRNLGPAPFLEPDQEEEEIAKAAAKEYIEWQNAAKQVLKDAWNLDTYSSPLQSTPETLQSPATAVAQHPPTLKRKASTYLTPAPHHSGAQKRPKSVAPPRPNPDSAVIAAINFIEDLQAQREGGRYRSIPPQAPVPTPNDIMAARANGTIETNPFHHTVRTAPLMADNRPRAPKLQQGEFQAFLPPTGTARTQGFQPVAPFNGQDSPSPPDGGFELFARHEGLQGFGTFDGAGRIMPEGLFQGVVEGLRDSSSAMEAGDGNGAAQGGGRPLDMSAFFGVQDGEADEKDGEGDVEMGDEL